MTERPILFSAPMVRALLAGTKTQTRRPLKPQPTGALLGQLERKSDKGVMRPKWWFSTPDRQIASDEWACPYGVPGDILWVRENLRATVDNQEISTVTYEADSAVAQIENSSEGADRWFDLWHYDSKRRSPGSMVPSIHMPRWASRISLRITDVRVERLNEISEADALAEGIIEKPDRIWWVDDGDPNHGYGSPRAAYAELWSQINGPGSWAADPWVWAVSFERI